MADSIVQRAKRLAPLFCQLLKNESHVARRYINLFGDWTRDSHSQKTAPRICAEHFKKLETVVHLATKAVTPLRSEEEIGHQPKPKTQPAAIKTIRPPDADSVGNTLIQLRQDGDGERRERMKALKLQLEKTPRKWVFDNRPPRIVHNEAELAEVLLEKMIGPVVDAMNALLGLARQKLKGCNIPPDLEIRAQDYTAQGARYKAQRLDHTVVAYGLRNYVKRITFFEEKAMGKLNLSKWHQYLPKKTDAKAKEKPAANPLRLLDMVEVGNWLPQVFNYVNAPVPDKKCMQSMALDGKVFIPNVWSQARREEKLGDNTKGVQWIADTWDTEIPAPKGDPPTAGMSSLYLIGVGLMAADHDARREASWPQKIDLFNMRAV